MTPGLSRLPAKDDTAKTISPFDHPFRLVPEKQPSCLIFRKKCMLDLHLIEFS